MQIPKNQSTFEALCREAGVTLPHASDLSTLASPFTVMGKTVANRIAYQAMEGCDGTTDGAPDELTIRRYLRFAAGGPGVIWFEATACLREGRANPRQLWLHENNMDAYKRLLDDIRETSVRENGYAPLIIMQATHSGRYSKPNGTPAPLIAYNDPIFEGDKPIAADRIVSDEYLDRVSEALIHSARLAEQVGFDGVDVKSCHRYLLCELLSAFERPGKYGGSFENRTRMLRQTAAGVVASTSADFITSCRLNLYDGFVYPYGFSVNPGQGIEPDYSEAKALVKELVALGMPILNFTMGNPYFNPHVNRPYARGGYEPPEHPMKGVERMLTGIREVASTIPGIPVISSGLSFLGSESAAVAAGCVKEGWFAMAGYGRQTLANPDVANDILKRGGPDPDRLCLCCSKCTEIMRKPGGTPGCAVRDTEVYTPIYKKLVLNK